MVSSLLIVVLCEVAVTGSDEVMPLNSTVLVKSSYCDSLNDEHLKRERHLIGKLTDVLLIFNESDREAADIGCVLRSAVSATILTPVQLHEVPCMQLLTVDAEPDELHVLITRGGPEMEFCDAQVYGAIPSVIEVRITTPEKGKELEYVTFNMITNGGHLRFDVDTEVSHAAKNLLIVFRTLASVAISGRPYENGFPKFHRASHLLSKPKLSEAKDRFLKKLEGHIQEAQLDSIVEEEEMRPEQLPSLYADLTMNMIEKAMGLSTGEGADDGGTSVTAEDGGVVELQHTMSDRSENVKETQKSTPQQQSRHVRKPLPEEHVPVNLLSFKKLKK